MRIICSAKSQVIGLTVEITKPLLALTALMGMVPMGVKETANGMLQSLFVLKRQPVSNYYFNEIIEYGVNTFY